MSETLAERPFPRGALVGAAILVGTTLVGASVARIVGVPSMVPEAAAVESRELRFEDRADGAVAVYEAKDGKLVDVLPPGTNGFVRGVLRGLARERKLEELGPEAPFRLTYWADGRLSLEDTATGRRVELEAFGATNTAAFARILKAGSVTP